MEDSEAGAVRGAPGKGVVVVLDLHAGHAVGVMLLADLDELAGLDDVEGGVAATGHGVFLLSELNIIRIAHAVNNKMQDAAFFRFCFLTLRFPQPP